MLHSVVKLFINALVGWLVVFATGFGCDGGGELLALLLVLLVFALPLSCWTFCVFYVKGRSGLAVCLAPTNTNEQEEEGGGGAEEGEEGGGGGEEEDEEV